MKKIVVFFAVMMLAFSAFAAQFHTVPLNNPAYRIISVAESRGIIPLQSDVKPYSLDVVRNLLSAISSSAQVSESEKALIADILSDFDNSYGSSDAALSDVFRNGYYRSEGENGTSTMAGVVVDSMQRAGLDFDRNFVIDSRNSVTAYLRGDLFGVLSYDMNFGVLGDKLDPAAYRKSDFTFKCEGFYLDLTKGGDRPDLIPDGRVYLGLAMAPEISSSLFGGKLAIRFASVEREWGPAMNNLALSGSARSFDALEVSVSPVSWLNYTVLNGSLGKFPLRFVDGRVWPSDSDLHSNVYDNNFSLHRVDLTISSLRLSVYESCVWKKRFELAYLNPIAIYMFAQNSLGDFDNMMAGVDFSYNIKGFGRIYGGLALDEANSMNPKKLLSFARNIIALQGGVVLPVGIGEFGNLRLQATYLPPFFGSHYLYYSYENPWGQGDFSTNYTNKGQSLSYPANPDTIELLMNFSTSFQKGWGLDVSVKESMSSAQYATDQNGHQGTTVLDTMSYNFDYEDKQFFSYIWENALSLDLEISKKFENSPVKVSAGLLCMSRWTRDYSVGALDSSSVYIYTIEDYEWDDLQSKMVLKPGIEPSATYYYNTGNSTVMGSWNSPEISCIGRVGVTIYQ